MKTKLCRDVTADVIAALLAGDAVAFPTETVYGLGADAFNEKAVQRLFELKGRPSDNPLIVHLADETKLADVAVDVSPEAYALFAAFAPGPLTLVLKRQPALPAAVSAGLDTVAVRIPAAPLARKLLAESGLALVAPSANRSGRPSPTTAEHVLEEFSGRIPFILDGGACDVGVESTVLDLTSDVPTILRPGRIDAAALSAVLGRDVVYLGRLEGPARSPGLRHRHYAPAAAVRIVGADEWIEAIRDNLPSDDGMSPVRTGAPGKTIGLFASAATIASISERLTDEERKHFVLYPYEGNGDAEAAARRLYAALRSLDAAGVSLILAERLPKTGAGIAYMDRLERAAADTDDRPAETARSVVFVCTGNTCRSPMAEALFNAKHPAGWIARSAGLAAFTGDEATAESVLVMGERGLDLSAHRSTRLSDALADETTLFVAMTKAHRTALARLFPERAEAIRTLLADEDVSDPFGYGSDTYRRVRDQIEAGVDRLIEELGQSEDD